MGAALALGLALPVVLAAQIPFDAVPDRQGLEGEATAMAGVVYGIQGVAACAEPGSAGLLGESTARTGEVMGVVGITASSSPGAAGGYFENTGGGPILRGIADGTTVFEVSDTGTVTAGLLIGAAVGLGPLGDLACSQPCLNGDVVFPAHGITHTELAAGLVTRDRLAPGAVTSDDIGQRALGSAHLADRAVTHQKLAPGGVQGIDVGLAAIVRNSLATGAAETADIEDDSIRGRHFSGLNAFFTVWEVHESCVGAHDLSSTGDCRTRSCGALFLNCDGFCIETSSVACSNSIYGYLVNRDIDPQ